MTPTNQCPQCEQTLEAGYAENLCPTCLLRVAIAETDQLADGPFENANDQLQPTVEELSAVFPQYEFLDLLGRGGMGCVYRVRQRSLNRIIALKLLPRRFANDAAFEERFSREAQALASLQHPNIVSCFDFGESQGWFYLAMEYVDGVDLRKAIRNGRIEPKQAMSIVSSICDALQYAHDEGIVHRDIKPENILLNRRGEVKIADFGLAKMAHRKPIQVTLTSHSQVLGTLHYMAPEQISQPREVDHRADLYSLGVVFYELLTGDLPVGRFKLPSEEQQFDQRVDDVVLRSLEREPADRYQHASQLKTDISHLDLQCSAANSPGKPPIKNSSRREIDNRDQSARQTRQLQIPVQLLWYASWATVACCAMYGVALLTGNFFSALPGNSFGPLNDRGIGLLVSFLTTFHASLGLLASRVARTQNNRLLAVILLLTALLPWSYATVIISPLCLWIIFVMAIQSSRADEGRGMRPIASAYGGQAPTRSATVSANGASRVAVFFLLLLMAVATSISVIAFAYLRSGTTARSNRGIQSTANRTIWRATFAVDGASVDNTNMSRFIHQRINHFRGNRTTCSAQFTDGFVTIHPIPESEYLGEIIRLLSSPGELQLRTMYRGPLEQSEEQAHSYVDQAGRVTDENGAVVAEWLPVATEHEAYFESLLGSSSPRLQSRFDALHLLVDTHEIQHQPSQLLQVRRQVQGPFGEPSIESTLQTDSSNSYDQTRVIIELSKDLGDRIAATATNPTDSIPAKTREPVLLVIDGHVYAANWREKQEGKVLETENLSPKESRYVGALIQSGPSPTNFDFASASGRQ